jgi:hypothetical protein
MMIVDVSPSAYEYDPSSDTVTLHFTRFSPPSSMPVRTPNLRSVAGQVLLDAAGFLIGVDLAEAYAGRRLVAMLGPHENVASTSPATLSLKEERAGTDGDGLLAIHIPNARATIRGGEKNPYL